MTNERHAKLPMTYALAHPGSNHRNALPGIVVGLHAGIFLPIAASAAHRAGLAGIGFVTQPGSSPN